MIGLKPIRQNTEQQVTGQVRRCSPPEYGLPTVPKLTDVKITQTRNLDVECLSVRWRTTDLYARHGDQCDWCLAWRGADVPLSLLVIW